MNRQTHTRERAIYRVTWIGFAVNLALSAGKLAAGILGHSSAMVADAIHSASDFATDLVVLLFVRVSAKPRDDDHDYGHGKYETLATLLIGLALAGVGLELLWSGGRAIRDFTRGVLPPQPGAVALWAAVVSIVAKELLYRYTACIGRQVNSPSVVANAWHHRSDALSSAGTLAGIGCAYFLGGDWRLADPAAAIVVALLILRVAWQLSKMGIDELLEKSLPREEEERILVADRRRSGRRVAAQSAHTAHRAEHRRRGAHPRRRRDERHRIAPPHRRDRTAAARRLRRRDDGLDPRRTAQMTPHGVPFWQERPSGRPASAASGTERISGIPSRFRGFSCHGTDVRPHRRGFCRDMQRSQGRSPHAKAREIWKFAEK